MIRLLLDQKTELKGLLDATRKERDEAFSALEAEKNYSASVDRSYAAAERTIDTLNKAFEHYSKAIELNEKTIALVEKQRDDAKKEARRAGKIAKVSTIVSAAMIGARLLGVF